MTRAKQAADHFLKHELGFRLGLLPTENANPKTSGFAELAQRDLPAAIHMLQSVDEEIVPLAQGVFSSRPVASMIEAFGRTLASGGRICFSSCGAPGRLCILLEASWRQFFQDLRQREPALADRLADLEDRVFSLMTGGDYALICSVENFEDYQSFGRQQVREAGLGTNDTLVGVSEGGETSSVIGSVHQAVDVGATAFFVFNNPARILAENIERSRQLIEDPRVTVLELVSGPMAITGSTRMQATTSELLVVGAALETALIAAIGKRLTPDELQRCGVEPDQPVDYAQRFVELLADLGQDAAVAAMAGLVEFENQLYRQKGLVTYMADACLLDIFTDTTERSPTFGLPRFRQHDDRVSPAPWAFVNNPCLPSPEAWRRVLRRDLRCLEWDAAMYRSLEAEEEMQAKPPRLGTAEVQRFQIGNEDAPSRYTGVDNAAILVALSDEIPRLAAAVDPLRTAFAALATPFARQAILAIGPVAPPSDLAASQWHVPVRLPASPLRLWQRLAAKLVLNTVSTTTMARVGRMMSNWMIYGIPTNKKAIDRGCRFLVDLAGVSYEEGCYALYETLEELAQSTEPGQQRPPPMPVILARLKARNA